MKRLVIILTFVLLLAGCKPTEEGLTVPQNVQQSSTMLTWDEVEGATHYIVRIGETTSSMVSTNSFSLDTLENGTYEFTVQAVNDITQSDVSTPIQIVINRVFEHPTTVSITDTTVSWNDTFANEYHVYVDDVLYASTETTSYDLNGLDVNHSYEITIKAEYSDGNSEFTTSVTFHHYDGVLQTYELIYNVNSTLDYLLHIETTFTVNGLTINDTDLRAEDFTTTGNQLLINTNDLTTLDEGSYVVLLLTTIGTIQLNLTVIDDLIPLFFSNQHLVYQSQEDMEFYVELFGGTIDSIGGNGITSDDYTIDTTGFTIKASYVESILDATPERERIILSVPISNSEGDILLFYIFIDMP